MEKRRTEIRLHHHIHDLGIKKTAAKSGHRSARRSQTQFTVQRDHSSFVMVLGTGVLTSDASLLYILYIQLDLPSQISMISNKVIVNNPFIDSTEVCVSP